MTSTKKEFLRQLRLSLFFRLPATEAHEVAADYEGFFDDKLGEGRSEAEVCREFGSPREVVKAILKEEGKDGRPLGALALVWALLGPWLLRMGGMPFFYLSDPERWIYVTITLLMTPLLWFFWRKSVYPAQSLHRGSFAVLCAIPVVSFGAFFAFVVYGVQHPQFLDFLLGSGKASAVGCFVESLADLAELVIAVILLISLLWAWGRSPWYLIPAAHALGCFEAIEQSLNCLHGMYIISYEGILRELLQRPLVAYGVAAFGGAVLTAFLVWRGGRHGRAA